MVKKILGLLLASAISFVVYAVAKDSNSSDSASSNAINTQAITALIESNTRLIVEDIKPSLVSGLAEVFTDQGSFYASNDGKFFIPSKIYQASPMGLIDVNEERNQLALSKVRLEGLKQFKDNMIVYPAKEEKYVVTVFTDITCGYCRVMHSKMDEYNKLGITVRYLAYPRYGIVDQTGQLTQSFKDLRSIWCHESPADALTKAKAGGAVEERICDAPIEGEFNFGIQAGVNGTPAIILENGYMLPGFREPKDLAETLANL